MSSNDDSGPSILYRTLLAPRALTDLEEIYGFRAQRAAAAAERWVEGLFEAIVSLSRFPRRCAIAPEETRIRIGLRHFIYGNYRILFTIDDERRLVKVSHIRHGARHEVSAADVDALSDGA